MARRTKSESLADEIVKLRRDILELEEQKTAKLERLIESLHRLATIQPLPEIASNLHYKTKGAIYTTNKFVAHCAPRRRGIARKRAIIPDAALASGIWQS